MCVQQTTPNQRKPVRAMSEVISVWPCDHGGVEVERTRVPQSVHCATCQATPVHYIPISTVERLVRERDQARAALARIASAESGQWGVIARKALRDTT